MKLTNAAALLASCSLFGAVLAIPNFEISKTSVSIDRHREALDNGEIVVRLQRTDDLFSDPTTSTEAKLLLEKNTHIALRIQLDPVAGTVNVNDQPVDLLTDEAQVTAIKAETFSLPLDHVSPVADPDMMLSLLGQMSPGIVGIEVKVESSPLTPSVGVVSYDSNDKTPTVGVISIRKVGLFIRVTEIEGQEIAHTTSVYSPILQLIVTGSEGKINKIETLSVDGKNPVDEALSNPGPVLPFSLPPLEIESPIESEKDGKDANNHRGHHPHPHSHFHHDHHRPTGVLAWIAQMLGLRSADRSNKGMTFGGGRRKGCKGMLKHAQNPTEISEANKDEKNGEAGMARHKSHRPAVENPFSGMVDDDEGYESNNEKPVSAKTMKNIGESLNKHAQGHAHSHSHKHGYNGGNGHKRHGRCLRGWFRRFSIGVITGFAMFAVVLFHPITLMTLSGLATFALFFHVVRRIVKKRRSQRDGQVQLGEGQQGELLFDNDADAKSYTDDEKLPILEEVVIVEEKSSA